MDEQPSSQPTKRYGKHSVLFWVLVYVAIAVVVYGLIYLLFIRDSSGSGGISY